MTGHKQIMQESQYPYSNPSTEDENFTDECDFSPLLTAENMAMANDATRKRGRMESPVRSESHDSDDTARSVVPDDDLQVTVDRIQDVLEASAKNREALFEHLRGRPCNYLASVILIPMMDEIIRPLQQVRKDMLDWYSDAERADRVRTELSGCPKMTKQNKLVLTMKANQIALPPPSIQPPPLVVQTDATEQQVVHRPIVRKKPKPPVDE